jgi:serine protease Do
MQVFRPVVAKASESTVRVKADGKDVCYGVVVDGDGYVLTKWSEIKDKNEVTVTLKNGVILTDVKLVTEGSKDDEFDLALVKVHARGLKPIEWAPSKIATVGRWVASVKNDTDPVGVGVVSVASRKFAFGDQPPKRMPSPNAGRLGIQLAPGTGGAKILFVEAKGPADVAGLKVNDVVYEVSGKKIPDDQVLIETIQGFKAGDKILMKVKRGSDDLELKATLGKVDFKQLGINPQELMGTKLSGRRGGFPVIIQHDTGVAPENCGGPLVDLDGKVVGINISRAGRTETYAIPSEEIQKLLPDLKTGKTTKVAKKDDDKKKIDQPPPSKDGVVLTVTGSLTAKDTLSKTRPGTFTKVHEVKLQKDTIYVIDMESTEIDSFLILEDAMGKKLAEDDDSGGFPNARIEFRAPADGTYRVIATTYDAKEIGAYTLNVRKK